jgi:hypothetical protein
MLFEKKIYLGQDMQKSLQYFEISDIFYERDFAIVIL